MPSRRGRPTKYSDDIAKRICRHLEAGIPFKYAVEAEGILETTAEKWLADGGQDDCKNADHRAFFEAVTRARAKGAVSLHTKVIRGGKGSDGARFVLERRFVEYRPVSRVEQTGADGGPIITEATVAAKLDALSIEELRRLAKG